MKKLLSLSVILATITAIYCGAWLFMGYKTNKTIDQFYTGSKNISFYGEKPALSGFPLVPVITYNKGFSTEDVKVTFSEITISGFPIPGFFLTLVAPNGIKISSYKTNKDFELDYLKTILTAPKNLPKSSNKKDISAWQKDGGIINIKELKAKKQSMQIAAVGTIGLDKNLQPTTYIFSKIKGHEELIKTLVNTGELKPLPAALALSALNAMIEVDPQSNVRLINAKIRIDNQVLFIGPIRTIKIPPIYWP